MSQNGISPRRRRSCASVPGLLLAALASACSPPGVSSPTPVASVPTPPPQPPASARLQMSGRVLNELGAPVSGAIVEVDYAPGGGESNPPSQCPLVALFCWFVTRTNDLGEYSVEFQPRPWPGFGLGYVYSFHEGYGVDVQWVPVGPSPAVRDLNIRVIRPILAGESTLVTVGPASSLCTDLEDLYVMQSRCEIVVIESGAGTLDVEARPVSEGAAPSMFWYTSGNYAGFIARPAPGVVSIPARGGTYRILVGLPEGSAPQQFNVTTSLR